MYNPMKKTPLLLSTLFTLSLGSASAFATSDDAKELTKAKDELAVLRQRFAEQHPKVQEQKLRIAQLQQRFDVEGRDSRKADADVRRAQPPIIRSRIKIRPAKEADGAPLKVIAGPTFVTQAGQTAVIEASELSISLTSSADEQNNITSTITITRAAPDGSGLDVVEIPVIKSRPGEPASASIRDLAVELVANLVEPRGINVDFPGGTLAQLLASINSSESAPFNLIASKEVLALPLPAFALRNVSPRDLAMAIDWLLDGYIIDLPAENPDRDGLPVFTVRVNPDRINPSSEQAEGASKPERFQSFPISALGGRFPVEEVVSTLNAAWTIDPSHRPEALRIKYHAATGILLVSSREGAALEIVNAVMRSLIDEAGRRPAPNP